MPPIYRRLGDGAVAFDRTSWQTLILTPAAAAIFETLDETRAGEEPVPMVRALELLRDELEVDPETPEIQQVLHSLQEMGMLGG